MTECRGWLLDLYADADDGLVLWFLGQDGRSHRFWQPFPVTFYAAGPSSRLRELWRYLRARPLELKLDRAQKIDLFPVLWTF